MKKFIVVMSFILIIIVFVGLNYLLWERENREDDLNNLKESGASSSMTINALNRQMDNMENSIRSRDESIEKITNDNETLSKNIEELKRVNALSADILKHKNDVINVLYNYNQGEDPITAVVEKWAEYIGAGDYKNAYQIWYGDYLEESSNNSDTIIIHESLDEYTKKYKDIVISIKIKSIRPQYIYFEDKNGDEPADYRIIDELASGDIFFVVELDVKLTEWALKYEIMFNEGANTKIFAVRYNSVNGKWHISKIIDIP